MRPATDGLRCFVAMRIRDDSDTDRLYFKVLKPLLKRELGIRAVRIDELHHNDNIDARLLQEIARSQLVIADLTYARPSVYFEAGYAFGRGMPVVYTSQADHEVHFDLRQRNIVRWSAPGDARFARRLIARIRRTIAPLVRTREVVNEERRLHHQFIELSPAQRNDKLREVGVKFLRKHRFRIERPKDPSEAPDPERGFRLVGNGTVETADLVVSQSITKGMLEGLGVYADLHTIPEKFTAGRQRHAQCILLSEGTVTRTRVEGALPRFVRTDEKTWTWNSERPDTERPDRFRFRNRAARMTIHIVDGIRSVPMLKKQLGALSASVARAADS